MTTHGRLEFVINGAAGTVTGSRFLLALPDGRGVLVDYGLFQGGKELRDRNRQPPDTETLHAGALLLTHAHLDHSGALPVLGKAGWRGTMFATPATAALCAIMLPDSGRIQEEDAERDARHGHAEPPLYTEDDAVNTARYIKPRLYQQPFAPLDGVTATFFRAGHIPGSAIALLDLPAAGGGRRSIAFSGDLGRYGAPILPDPDPPPAADYLVVESTYGDRDHPVQSAEHLLGDALKEALQHGGPILIPAFAVGRTQELLYVLRALQDTGELPCVPIYVDSPLATGATAVLAGHPEEYDAEMAERIRNGSSPLEPHGLTIVRSAEESKKLNAVTGPAIIIAGSGMATGGRILHHLEHHLDDPRTTVLFAGYQGEGTLGRQLLDGATQVNMYGHTVPVRAQIMDVQGLSAHADRGEVLRWLKQALRPPRRLFLVHGEPASAAALQSLIEQQLGWMVSVAQLGERIALD
ncbi:MAG TPA: MBL fold metallo-hydrolase [Dehalococcoidia bacterium]|nr:MBL fold metallo-hydrolase [Dehalococcoidia bacterium]